MSEVNYIFYISGDIKGIDITAYINHPAVCNGKIDLSNISPKTVFCRMDRVFNLNMTKFTIAEAKDDEDSFLWLNVESPYTDVSQVETNLPVRVTYSFNLIEWAIFITLKIFRRANKLIRIIKWKSTN